jgi:CheY-like chemotaxis protein/HPt (histidine-containing phosphotransfer) domain-containing protein
MRPVRGPRSLVVDDHAINREVLVQQLELLGIAADTARNGAEALNAWTPGRYAAVLADLHMPGMDGYELTRLIRGAEATEAAPHTPIVAVTANALRGEAERCLAAGMDGFLAKPVAIDALARVLQPWLPGLGPAEAGGDTGKPETALFDPGRLTGLFGNDRRRLARLVAGFAKAAAADVAAMRGAKTAAVLAEAAHRLKGASRTVGAVRLAAVAERVEVAVRDGDAAVTEQFETLLAETVKAAMATSPWRLAGRGNGGGPLNRLAGRSGSRRPGHCGSPAAFSDRPPPCGATA